MTRIIYKNRWGVECEVDASEIVSVEGFAAATAMSEATLETDVEGLIKRLGKLAQAPVLLTKGGNTISINAGPPEYVTALHEAASALSRLSEQVKALEGERDEQPSEPGAFEGDIFFGDRRNSTRGTHRWTDGKWGTLPTDAEALMSLLAKARQRAEAAELQLSKAEAQMKGMREALITARDLLLERIQGSHARSAAHNARLVIDAALEKSAAKP